MRTLKSLVLSFIKEEDGIAVAEYGLLLGIVAVGFLAILVAFYPKFQAWWSDMSSDILGSNSLQPTPGS